jgi:serine/threonine-protein kinase RsbW
VTRPAGRPDGAARSPERAVRRRGHGWRFRGPAGGHEGEDRRVCSRPRPRLADGGTVETFRRRFRHEPASVRRARHDLLTWLAACGVPPGTGVDAAAVVVSELVANAVLHASPMSDGTFEVAWRRVGHALHVEVTDAGNDAGAPRLVEVELESPGGRGLVIVDSLALEWGVCPNAAGRTVHAQVDMGWPMAC